MKISPASVPEKLFLLPPKQAWQNIHIQKSGFKCNEYVDYRFNCRTKHSSDFESGGNAGPVLQIHFLLFKKITFCRIITFPAEAFLFYFPLSTFPINSVFFFRFHCLIRILPFHRLFFCREHFMIQASPVFAFLCTLRPFQCYERQAASRSFRSSLYNKFPAL